ncbi:hypothetical protein AEAC466_13365 [Asticcacaulis sp. AC466]|uniref:caspase family protein n=1 Tax=Asticcacaulis sp. AC466 TaxID=1282362 RepID=UPI0003C3F2D5|nr:caspase family protein [Asticcacaulis sp. AC466]ESQ83235.1 hypothetical protein AEAC466_13365 [Asticcacaulis sp. AC466]
MAKSLAFVVGIAKAQKDGFGPLTACEKDAVAMRELLQATGRFHVEIAIDVSAASLKTIIRTQYDKHEAVEEVLFYFSGHGESLRSASYMVFDGYNVASPDLTGIALSDLIDLLRPFSADRTVLIVDACFSGQHLIKSSNPTFAVQHQLKSLWFFASSGDKEETPAGAELSPFTNGFIEIIAQIPGPEIYYMDIASGLRTVYGTEANISPTVNIASDVRQMFCPDKASLQTVLDRYASPESAGDDTEQEHDQQLEELALVESESVSDLLILSEYEAKLTNETQAQELLQTIQSNIVTRVETTNTVAEFYTFKLESKDHYDSVHDHEAIVSALKNAKRPDRFVEARSVRREKKPKRSIWEFAPFANVLEAKEYEIEYILVNHSSIKRVHFRLLAIPKFGALRRGVLEIVFAPSLERCFVYSRFALQWRSDFEEFDNSSGLSDWSRHVVGWDGLPSDLIDEMASGLCHRISDHVRAVSDELSRR